MCAGKKLFEVWILIKRFQKFAKSFSCDKYFWDEKFTFFYNCEMSKASKSLFVQFLYKKTNTFIQLV